MCSFYLCCSPTSIFLLKLYTTGTRIQVPCLISLRIYRLMNVIAIFAIKNRRWSEKNAKKTLTYGFPDWILTSFSECCFYRDIQFSVTFYIEHNNVVVVVDSIGYYIFECITFIVYVTFILRRCLLISILYFVGKVHDLHDTHNNWMGITVTVPSFHYLSIEKVLQLVNSPHCLIHCLNGVRKLKLYVRTFRKIQ